eukprot:jgi/Botrbrau1/13024/Bobra.0389s0017.1
MSPHFIAQARLRAMKMLCQLSCQSATSNRNKVQDRRNLDRQAAMRVLECVLVALLAGPVVCALNPCLLTQQYEMLNLRDKNPATIFEPYDPSLVAPRLQTMDRLPASPTRGEKLWGVSRAPERKRVPLGDIPEHMSAKANPPQTIGGPPRGWPNTHKMNPPNNLSPAPSSTEHEYPL